MDTPKSLFRPIKRRRAFEDVSNGIKELIFRGELNSGDRLPPEGDLARQYNVGRQTIREALRFLEVSGFVHIQKGGTGGAFIEDAVLDAISQSFVDAAKMKKVTIEGVMEVRQEIERLVLKNAIKNADDADIKALEEVLLSTEKKTVANEDTLYENVLFHKLLAKASKNQVLIIIVDLLMAVISDFMKAYGTLKDERKHRIDEHKELLRAIIEKREDLALKVLQRHTRVVEDMVKKSPKAPKRR
jgi:DNA-binding FadR family transcriptional regulator